MVYIKDIGTPITDTELIDSVLAGRRDDYAELVRRHHGAVLGLCRAMLGDPALAEDAAQESFLNAYRSLGDFRGGAAFSTWLYRIATNRCLDHIRRRARRAEESLDALIESAGPDIERMLDAGQPARDPVEDADLAARVLARLSPDYRLILTLREVQGLSYDELADALECSLDAVKARLRRARAALQEEVRHILGPRGV